MLPPFLPMATAFLCSHIPMFARLVNILSACLEGANMWDICVLEWEKK